MSMARAHALSIPPPIRRRKLLVAKRLDSAFDFKERRLAQRKKQKRIFWGVIAGIGSIILMSLLFYLEASSLGNDPGKLALLTAQLEKAKTPQEAEKIAAQIERLEENSKKTPVIQKIELNKPFKLSASGTNFKMNFDSVWFYDTKGSPFGEDRNVKFVVCYSYKNLGPRQGSPNIYGGELRTVKNHIYGLRNIEGNQGYDDAIFGLAVTPASEIESSGKGLLYCWLPRNTEFPTDFDIRGDVNGTIKLPKKIMLKRQVMYQKPSTTFVPCIPQPIVKDIGLIDASTSLDAFESPKPPVDTMKMVTFRQTGMGMPAEARPTRFVRLKKQ